MPQALFIDLGNIVLMSKNTNHSNKKKQKNQNDWDKNGTKAQLETTENTTGKHSRLTFLIMILHTVQFWIGLKKTGKERENHFSTFRP